MLLLYKKKKAATAPPLGPRVLDGIPNPLIACGLRLLLLSYIDGPAIRIRRSTDNVEKDIYFNTSTGSIDTTSLLSFIGSADGYIVRAYNQTRNGLDLINADRATQLKLVNAGVVYTNNNKPIMYHPPSTVNYLEAVYEKTAPFTGIICGDATNMVVAGGDHILSGYMTNTFSFWPYPGSKTYYMDNGGSQVMSSYSINTDPKITATVIYNGASSQMFINGKPNSGTTANNAGDGLTLACPYYKTGSVAFHTWEYIEFQYVLNITQINTIRIDQMLYFSLA